MTSSQAVPANTRSNRSVALAKKSQKAIEKEKILAAAQEVKGLTELLDALSNILAVSILQIIKKL